MTIFWTVTIASIVLTLLAWAHDTYQRARRRCLRDTQDEIARIAAAYRPHHW